MRSLTLGDRPTDGAGELFSWEKKAGEHIYRCPVSARFRPYGSLECAATNRHQSKTSYRLVVLKCCLEFAECHVGGGAAVIPLDVVLVYLQGLGGIGQGIAIALCAQVCQAAVAVVDGVGWIDLQGLRVVLDSVFIVFI